MKGRFGDYRAICDLSGWKCWRSEMRYRWDGLLVYKKFWTPYPEYLIPPKVDENTATPDARPEQPIIVDNNS